MEIDIRKAQPEDVRLVLPLIYSSGPHEFDYVLHVGNKTTLDYLSFAFPTKSGRQSHRVHTVATIDNQVVGVGAFYSGRDSLRLDLGDSWTALRFYGPLQVMKVAQRAGHLESVIPPLASDAGLIIQLGVSEEFRGCGIGKALIQYQIELARRIRLRKCVLDVAVTNPRAQALYARLGFKVVQESEWEYRNAEIHVPGQRRMELVL